MAICDFGALGGKEAMLKNTAMHSDLDGTPLRRSKGDTGKGTEKKRHDNLRQFLTVQFSSQLVS